MIAMLTLPPVDFLSQTLLAFLALALLGGLVWSAERVLLPLTQVEGGEVVSLRPPDPPDPAVVEQATLVTTTTQGQEASRPPTPVPVKPRSGDQDDGATPPTPPDPVVPAISGEVVHRHYHWTFRSQRDRARQEWRHFGMDLNLSGERYRQFRAEERAEKTSDYVRYAATPMPELDILAAKFLILHRQEQLSPFDAACNVLSFAQSCVTYQYDHETHPDAWDWPKYPIESLVEEAGDCEDHAILAAALLNKLGYAVGLIEVPHHMALGIACAAGIEGGGYVHDPRTGLNYYYAETTSTGWRIGELPPDIRASTLTIYPVQYAVSPADGETEV